MTSRTRSLLGLVLALPLLGLIAGIFACLPVPIGDPEKSKVDQKLVGGWIVADGETKSTLYIVTAFDARTYLVTSLGFEQNADKTIKPGKVLNMKAWLTPIGDKTFICAEPFNPAVTLGTDKDDEKKIYFVAKVAIKGEDLELLPTKPDSDLLKNIKTTAEAEKVLKDNVNGAAIFSEPITFKRMGKGQEENIKAILKAFNMD